MRYRCQDRDCGKIVDDESMPPPLLHHMPARSYKKGEFGATEDVTFPAYTVKKCPWCRGNLVPVPLPEGAP